MGLTNMSYVHAKWEEMPGDELADVVFGVNCYYRMQDIDQARINLNNGARRLAMIGMTSGPKKPHYWDIHQELGYRIKFSRRDYIHLTNLLYGLGIDVNCKIIDLQRTYTYASEQQFIEQNLNGILTPDFDRTEAMNILLRYTSTVDGKVVYVHHFKAALLYWKPEQRLSLRS